MTQVVYYHHVPKGLFDISVPITFKDNETYTKCAFFSLGVAFEFLVQGDFTISINEQFKN